MKIHLSKKKSIIFCLIIILFISSILPIVTGNKTSLNNNILINEKQKFYDIYKQNQTCFGPLKDYKIDIKNIGLEKLETIVENHQLLNGPMDSPWPMYCHDSRNTGRSPYSTIDNMGVEKWRFDTIAECSGSPIIDDQGIIYIGSLYGLFAVFPNGTFKWQFWTDGVIVSAPAIDENKILYYGTIWDNKFHAIYANNGTVKWKYPLGSTWASSTIGDDGIIYASATDNWNVVAFYQNGTPKWGFHANEKIYSSPAIGTDNTIYFGSWDNHLYALYQNNGTLKWKYNTGGGIRTSPCIDDNGIIYTVSATNGYLNAIYPNGTLKWRTYTNGGTSPTVGSDGTIYCGWTNLYAINPEDGSIKWTFDPGEDRRIEEGTPCTSAEGTIYFGTHIGEYYGGEIIAVNPDGTEKWRVMIATDWVMSAPAIGSDGTVYAGSWNDGWYPGSWGYLHAINKYDPNAPSAPEISGPTSGKIETEYNFIFKSTSPLNRDIYYVIDWDQNKDPEVKGPYPSGEEVIVKHSWTYIDTYIIKARAIDTENLWGPWGSLEVIIPLNQQSSQNINLQSKSSVLFQFLQQIMNDI